MQTAEHSNVEIPSGNSTPLLEKNPIISQEDKIASTSLESEVKLPAKILPLIPAQELKQGAAIHEEITAGLRDGFYREQAVILLSLSSPVWEKGQKSVHAFYDVASRFWLSVAGVSEEEKSPTLVMAELPKTRFPEWLSSTAADAWSARCRLMRDVAVGLYQCRASGATHIAWNRQQLYLDAQGRAQLLPGFSETAVAEADDVFALGQLLWCMVSRSTTPVDGWEQGKGLPQHCPPEVIALIQACTEPTESARPSLKTLAKGLDILWQRAEQGFSDTPPLLPQTSSPLQKDQKYEAPSLTDSTATITSTQLSQVQSSGSLNLLLVDDQTVSWLSAADPRYQVGVKLCALRDSLAQPVESKASLPKLQEEIQRTLIGSPIEMLLWVGEEGEEPSHSFQETAWRLCQAPQWQAYRPGDPPPSTWLPLLINLHQSGIHSPLFTRTHQLPDEVAAFTDSEWQILHSHYALFWLVQGMGQLAEPCNLYEVNALHRGRTRLLLHSQKSDAFKWEESTYFMPHNTDDQLLPARYARYTSDPTCDFNTWEGRYQGKISSAVQEVTSAPIALTPAKDLAFNRQALIIHDEKTALGRGAFGEVLHGTYQGQPVAVKRFKETQLSGNDQAQLKDEAKVMAELHSPFLVRSLGLSLESPPLLVMELAEGGSLYPRLKDASQELPWVWRLRVLRDIALGLSVLHAHELLHRDLKSLNILLDAAGRAKLCDFGLSTLKSQAKDTADVGTLLWNAPEVLAGKAATPASDVYSFAMICWEVVTRRLPYKDPVSGKIKPGFEQRVQTGEREMIPSDCPPELAVVIQACWAQDASQRPTAGQVAQVLEDLWQKVVKAEQSQPTLKRQTSSLMPSINLENKRTKPLTPNEVKADAQLSSNNERKVFVSDSPSKLTGDWSGLSSEMLASLMPELAKQSVAPEKKTGQFEHNQIASSTRAVNEDKSLAASRTTASSSSSTSTPVDLQLSGLSPEALQSLMPDLPRQGVAPVEKIAPVIDSQWSDLPSGLLHSLLPDLFKQGASVSEESQSSRPTEQDQKPLTPTSSTTPSQTAAAEFKTLLAQSQQQPPCWQDKQSPEYTLGVKLQRLREKVLADPYITQELSCYIAPNGQSQAGIGQSSEPLYPWVQRELLQGPAQVLLLQGLAGAGKSTFNRSLLRTLWQDPAWQSYRPGDPIPRAPVPVFMPLSSAQVNPRNLWDYYHHLPEISFTSEEIRLLQSDYHTVWIADGYDEMPGQAAPNVYDGNHLNQTAGRVKLVIGCRSQRVQALVEADSFVPHTLNGAPDWLIYRMRHVSPFTAQQTQDYIEKYVAQYRHDQERPKDWDVARYQAEFKAIPELQTLIDTPFMLWMTLSILPELAKEQLPTPAKTPSKTSEPVDKRTTRETKETSESPEVKVSPRTEKTPITRAALYDRFMDTWFTRQARKAYQQRNYLKDPAAILGEARKQALKQATDQTGGNDVQVVWLKAAYRVFCLTFAEYLLQARQVGLRYEPTSTPESKTTSHGETLLSRLLGDTLLDSARLRQGSPLNESRDHTWRFMHASLFDYFITTSVAEQLLLTPEPDPSGSEVSELGPLGTHRYDRAVTLFMQQRLTPDQVRFLVDRTQGNLALQAVFFQLIERSKTDSAIAVASGNAVTVLNISGVSLIGRDWQGVRIPGANLHYGNLAYMNLSGADLTGVDLTRTWLYGTNLEGATLEDVEWGEQPGPELECEAEVKAIAYHPYEPWLAVTQGQTIEIRHRETSEIVGKPFTGHEKWVTSVSFSPDGKLLASGSEDQRVRLWLMDSQEPLGAPLAGHTKSVESVSFSPDGKLVASGSHDKTVRLWQVANGEPQGAPLTGHKKRVTSVSFSPDGQLLASGSWDKTVRLWQVASREPLGIPLTGHKQWVTSVSFSPDGQTLASGGDDQTVRLWQVASREPLGKLLTGDIVGVGSVSFSPDGQLLASGSQNGVVRLWQVASQEPLGKPLTGHKYAVTNMSFSPDGQLLASGSRHGEVRLWQVISQEPLGAPLTGHEGYVTSVSFSPDGQLLASGSRDKTVRLWSVASREPLGERLTGHEDDVTSVSFSPDGQLLASGGSDYAVRLWQVASQEPLGKTLIDKDDESIEYEESMVKSVSFSPDGQLLASGGTDNAVRLWSVATRKLLGIPLTGHEDWVTSVSFSPDGQLLASGSWDKTVRLWSVASREPLGEPLTGHEDQVMSVSFSPDGQLLASGSDDKTVWLWQVASGEPQGEPLTGHTKMVESVSFSPDGQLLASGSGDKTVRLWSVASHRCLIVFTWLAGINSIAFQRPTIQRIEGGDGQLLAMGDDNGVVSFWLLSGGLCRDIEQTEVAEIKAQPSMDDEDDGENENKKTLSQPPQPSEWQLLGSSRSSSMQLWTSGVQLSGCRMSLLSKRLLEQYGADVSEVKLITTQADKQSADQERKYETVPPKPQTPESMSTHPALTATAQSSSTSHLSFSELASTSASSSSFSPSTLVTGSPSTTVLVSSTTHTDLTIPSTSSLPTPPFGQTTATTQEPEPVLIPLVNQNNPTPPVTTTTGLTTPGGPALMAPRPRTPSTTPGIRLSSTPKDRNSCLPNCGGNNRCF